ncbi:RimJ/RimL family protein N-acetyltransferase [Arthrobacter sp. W4I7]|nr:RimJ/RimL family protein N-acetyltransferase [Arthrobacter sp. W4I7]
MWITRISFTGARAEWQDGGVESLETKRLILRPWEPEDADFVLDLYSRWEVQRFIGNQPRVMRKRAQAEERILTWRSMGNPFHGVWAVQLKEPAPLQDPALLQEPAQLKDPAQPQNSPPLAGTLLLKSIPASGETLPLQPSGETEIGWHFHPDHWGHGYASEAASAVLAHAFDNGLDRILAVTAPANTASQRVCLRIGMTHRGQTNRYHNATCELFEVTSP